jgi:hypothetical protein
MNDRWRRGAWFLLSTLLWPATGQAQVHHHPARPDTTAHHHAKATVQQQRSTRREQEPGAMPTSEMDMSEMGMSMTGAYGPYSMSREASGTAWQPDAARHEGLHVMRGAWMAMLHGYADVVYDKQGGERGDEKVFSDNMAMGIAQRSLGAGRLGVRAMLSLEPTTIGKEGYPLLLQTGETANGRTRLIDRQHPHDLFMELAASYSVSAGNRSLFLYGGLPGEPALGPPAFMHRFSGVNIPAAPITHHWLDSTHITFGVLTAGGVVDRIKVEASIFRGREPDQDRWNIESPRLDSHSFRLSANPTEHWALQASHGRIHSPEQLEPEVHQDRTTVSVIHDGTFGDTGRWEGTFAWGRNHNRPGRILDGLLAEAAAEMEERHTIFARAERVEKDELFLEDDPRAGVIFEVGELTAGYRYDLRRSARTTFGMGFAVTWSQIPRELRDVYGKSPTSGLLFVRARLD